jgi:hypothetical protein
MTKSEIIKTSGGKVRRRAGVITSGGEDISTKLKTTSGGKVRRRTVVILSIYSALTAAFFVLYLFADVIRSPYHILFIAVNFALALCLAKGQYSPLLAAMGATVIADFLLVSNWLVLGIAFFIIVQLFYFHAQNGRAFGWFNLLSVWLVYIITGTLVFNGILDIDTTLLFVATLYGIISIINNVRPKNNFLSLGIFLLFICDLFIMLSWFDLAAGFNYAWLFYIPSQYFVVLHFALTTRSEY